MISTAANSSDDKNARGTWWFSVRQGLPPTVWDGGLGELWAG